MPKIASHICWFLRLAVWLEHALFFVRNRTARRLLILYFQGVSQIVALQSTSQRSMPFRRSARPNSVTKAVFGTSAFVAALVLLSGLVAVSLSEMRRDANEIDDARASHAARAAIKSFQSRLGSTARDNAVWDDAYSQIRSSNGASWAYENWGKVSADYPLYDASIVFTPTLGVLSSYKKGVAFDPMKDFGVALLRLVANSSDTEPSATTAFIATPEGLYLLAADRIQPFDSRPDPSTLHTLVYAKLLTPDVVRQLDETFDITGLRLVSAPQRQDLSMPLLGSDGRAVGYFEWPSRLPGDRAFAHVRDYLAAAIVVLVCLFVALLLAGARTATRHKNEAERYRDRALHDDLTGLRNRAGLVESFERIESPQALAIVDLDGFKDVNDAWGHDVGDSLIQEVAARLRDAVVHGEVARLGGDEFALMTDPADMRHASGRVLDVLRAPFFIKGHTVEVGASIGAAFPEEGCDRLELMRRADMALYQVKSNGRGHFVSYGPELDRDRETRAELEERLRRAVSEGEIRAFFQPLVDAATGELQGVEALARWRTKEGPVSPEVFIPVAERAGLIEDLGKLMLRQAIAAAKLWEGVYVSVNVSPSQLRNPAFSKDVMTIVREAAFDPRLLTLEVTEGVLITNPDQAKRTMNALKTEGVKFALDDFGCGYASIGALREFGFDRMKIDRSLVEGIDAPEGVKILNATILIAEALGIEVTAEGVETEPQAAALASAGCDQLQGYLIGRPMDVVQLNAFVANRKIA